MAYNIIFDIDQTIVDSSSVEEYRNSGNWDAALHEIDAGNVRPYTGIVELIRDARTYGHNIAFVSTSPERYCRRIFHRIGLNPDDYCAFVPYTRELYHGNKTGMYNEAINHFGNPYQPLVIVGDSDKDISSANGLNYQYNLFTIRCLWGMSNEKIERELEAAGHPVQTAPYLIMKHVTELRDFLYYRWSVKHDENDVAYIYNYYSTGNGRFHDIFTDYFLRDIKGYDKQVERKPVYIRKWAIQFLGEYIEEIMHNHNVADAGRVGVMIVPSSTAGRWNAALEEILTELVRIKGIVNCAHIMIRHTEREAAHNANDRRVESNVNTMRINNPEALRQLSILIILDDITTTGNTYQACDDIIERDTLGIFNGTIEHVALAKTKNLQFIGRRNNTCDPEQVISTDPQMPDVRCADTYWAVNNNFEFKRIYHRNASCDRNGVRWGFVGIEGIKYYLPLNSQLCNRCNFPNNVNAAVIDPVNDGAPF